MSTIISSCIDVLKLFLLMPGLRWTILFFCAALTFIPDAWAMYFNIKSIINNYKSIIGFVLILSICMIAYIDIATFIKYFYKEYINKKTKKNYLKYLTKEEKEIIRYMLEKDEQTLIIRRVNSAALALEGKGILVLLNQTHSILEVPYIMPDWLWKYVKNNQKIFESKKNMDP